MRLSQLPEIQNPAPFLALNENETIDVALHYMLAGNTTAVVVTDDDGCFSGLFTQSDLSRRLTGAGTRGFDRLHLRDVMARDAVIAMMDDDATGIIGKMARTKIRHIPVMTDTRRVTALLEYNGLSDKPLPRYQTRAQPRPQPSLARRRLSALRASLAKGYQPPLIAGSMVLYALVITALLY